MLIVHACACAPACATLLHACAAASGLSTVDDKIWQCAAAHWQPASLHAEPGAFRGKIRAQARRCDKAAAGKDVGAGLNKSPRALENFDVLLPMPRSVLTARLCTGSASAASAQRSGGQAQAGGGCTHTAATGPWAEPPAAAALWQRRQQRGQQREHRAQHPACGAHTCRSCNWLLLFATLKQGLALFKQQLSCCHFQAAGAAAVAAAQAPSTAPSLRCAHWQVLQLVPAICHS